MSVQQSLYEKHCHVLLGSLTGGASDELCSRFVSGAFKSIIDEQIQPISTSSVDDYTSQIIASVDPAFYEAELITAATFLHVFIQANFTGPALRFDPVTCVVNVQDIDSFNTLCIEALASSGEPASSLTVYPHILLYALVVLNKLVTIENQLRPFAKWWNSRALIIHQSLLLGQSAGLHAQFFTNLDETVVNSIASQLETNSDLKQDVETCSYLEIARAQTTYSHEPRAEKSLELARQCSGLVYFLTGVKGKRTKFQQNETSQLIFLAKSRVRQSSQPPAAKKLKNNVHQPALLDLDSDILLDKLRFSDLNIDEASNIPEELKTLDINNQPELRDIDTALILLKLRTIKQSTPHKDMLIEEELLAMVNRIIDSPESSVNWSLFSRALWERSLLESDSVKTVERGTLQIQSLVEELGQANVTKFLSKIDNGESETGSVVDRLNYIHQVIPLPKWEMDRTLAEQYMKLGALKSAIEVYERLEMWADAALCYAVVGQEEKGKELLMGHLESHPKDYRGWSILGDITLNPEYWHKAWEIGHYAQAKRSLGHYYYSPPRGANIKRDPDLAIKYLNDSLQVNPLYHEAWFIYGCAGLETSQWELAAEAFSRSVALDEKDSKSWSNLGTALLRLDKKKGAFNALKRAVSVAPPSDWKIWDNYVMVAADLQEWNEVVRGTKKIISVRSGKEGERSLDFKVLDVLVQILVSTDYTETPDLFQKSCLNLFNNTIPSLITSDSRLWKLVAKTHVWQKKPWAALNDYEKGFRVYTHSPLVETEERVWNDAVDYCQELVDAYSNFGPMEGEYGEGSVVCKDWKFKARSSYRLLLGRGKNIWENSEGWARLETIKENLALM